MIFVIGISNYYGGGKVILNAFIDSHIPNIILAPKEMKNSKQDNLLFLPNMLYRKELLFFVYGLIIPFILRHRKIETILNLGDIPVRTHKKQFMLFDWPYAAYPQKVRWKEMALKDYIIRRTKMILFNRWHKYVDVFGFQHSAIAKTMASRYKIPKFYIWPNGINVAREVKPLNYSDNLNVLVLSKPYPHKRLFDIISLLRYVDYRVNVTLTFNIADNTESEKFHNKVLSIENDLVTFNYLGDVKVDEIPNLYESHHCLILPSELESFSGLMVESCFYKRPILCCHEEFNTEVSGSNAYFYPTGDIVKMREVFDQMVSDIQEDKVEFIPNAAYTNQWKEISTKILRDIEND